MPCRYGLDKPTATIFFEYGFVDGDLTTTHLDYIVLRGYNAAFEAFDSGETNPTEEEQKQIVVQSDGVIPLDLVAELLPGTPFPSEVAVMLTGTLEYHLDEFPTSLKEDEAELQTFTDKEGHVAGQKRACVLLRVRTKRLLYKMMASLKDIPEGDTPFTVTENKEQVWVPWGVAQKDALFVVNM